MDRKERFEQSDAGETLRAPMERLRAALAAERSPEYRKRQLMAEFDRQQGSRRLSRGWFSWTVAAASIAFLALAILPIRHSPPGSAPRQDSAGWVEEFEAEEGFAPLPYAMPVAGGERLWVERTELEGAALARLGLDFPVADGTDVEADVLLGDDGLPRAVRVVGYAEL